LTICSRKSEEITVETYYSAESLPEAWDLLLPAGHFLKKQSILLSEQSHLPDVSFIYCLVYKDGRPQAAAYFQLLNVKAQHLNPEVFKNWQYAAWSLFINIARPKLLVAGHLFRHDVCSYYCKTGMASFDTYSLYRAAIDKTLKESCASAVLIKDMRADLATYFQHYAPHYMLLRNDISMELQLPVTWQSVADYEKALKHKYAQRYRKVRHAFDGVAVKELSGDEVEQNKDRIYTLYKEVCERQPARIGFLSPEFIPVLCKHHPELKVWGIYEDEKMVGFLSAWVKTDVFDMFYIGFDYSRNNELQLYFNILFLTIELAIAAHKPKLILGRTALDAKARLGAKPHYLDTFVYIRNRFIRNAIQQFQNNTAQQEGAWEQRHPLK
jgi:hypothetical protein